MIPGDLSEIPRTHSNGTRAHLTRVFAMGNKSSGLKKGELSAEGGAATMRAYFSDGTRAQEPKLSLMPRARPSFWAP